MPLNDFIKIARWVFFKTSADTGAACCRLLLSLLSGYNKIKDSALLNVSSELSVASVRQFHSL